MQANVTFLLHAAVVVVAAGVVVVAAGVDVVVAHLVREAAPAPTAVIVASCHGSEQLLQRKRHGNQIKSLVQIESMRMRGGVTHSRN